MRMQIGLLVLLLLLSTTAFSQTFKYTTVQVPSSSATGVFGVNDNGDMVGTFTPISGGESGFLYSGGVYQTIACPNAVDTLAEGINNSGVIVGWCGDAGFIYQDGAYTFVSHPGARLTAFLGINNQGVITGVWQPKEGPYQHTFTYANGVFTPITTLRLPTGINNAGTLAGLACNSKQNLCHGAIRVGNKTKAVKYPKATGTFLGGINDNGDVVGYWGPNGTSLVYNIPTKRFTSFTVDGSVVSQPYGINNLGEIVGTYSDGVTEYGYYGSIQ